MYHDPGEIIIHMHCVDRVQRAMAAPPTLWQFYVSYLLNVAM